jgi:hypothetical protein
MLLQDLEHLVARILFQTSRTSVVKYIFFCDPCNVEIEHYTSAGSYTIKYIDGKPIYFNSKNERINSPIPETLPCIKCAEPASRKVDWAELKVAVSRQGSDNAPVDIVVGRDAQARWDDIHRRQELRDKTRKETKSVGLTATGRNEFKPLSAGDRKLRKTAGKQIDNGGYNPIYDAKDKKLI